MPIETTNAPAAMQRQEITRVFIYGALRLPDPAPTMTTLEVRDLYAASGRPELSSAQINGPELIGNEHHYTFHRAVGTKAFELKSDEDLSKIKPSAELVKCLAAFEPQTASGDLTYIHAAVVVIENRGRYPVTAPSELVPWMF